MATLAIDYPERRNPLFPAAVILILLTLALATIVLQQHAAQRHGVEADIVRDCLSRNGALEKWMNFDTGRQALICQVRDNVWGIQIIKDRREITSFIKNKISRIEQVYQYLLNRGYRFVR